MKFKINCPIKNLKAKLPLWSTITHYHHLHNLSIKFTCSKKIISHGQDFFSPLFLPKKSASDKATWWINNNLLFPPHNYAIIFGVFLQPPKNMKLLLLSMHLLYDVKYNVPQQLKLHVNERHRRMANDPEHGALEGCSIRHNVVENTLWQSYACTFFVRQCFKLVLNNMFFKIIF